MRRGRESRRRIRIRNTWRPRKDALIVTAEEVASCRYLLAPALHSGQKWDGIEVVNRFCRAPESVETKAALKG